MSLQDIRTDVLRAFGATGAVLDELLHYNRPRFVAPMLPLRFPMLDERFVETWAAYAEEAEQAGVFETLRRKLIQLRFPIEAGISQTDTYCAATRKGAWEVTAEIAGIQPRRPEDMRLWLYPTPVGHVPVVLVPDRTDFVQIIQAVTRKNEPIDIPTSMGACMLAGYNNWDRIRRIKADWQARHPFPTASAWQHEFKQIIPQKARYQDRFILLSNGAYSAVPAEALGLSEEAWREASLMIRLEHECTHYFTRRVLGGMHNALFDELLCDYMGLIAATGRFRVDWFLHFMGLEGYPTYREGGRLQNYKGTPPLSDEATAVLYHLVHAAATHLETIDAERTLRFDDMPERAYMVLILASLTLEQLASDEAAVYYAEAQARLEASTIEA